MAIEVSRVDNRDAVMSHSTEVDGNEMEVRIGYNALLHKAARRGNLSLCRTLLLSDAPSLNVSLDDYGNSPLHTAASNGHDRVVQCFLDYCADCSRRNIYNLTPLQVASNEKCRDLLKGASSNPSSTEKEQTARAVTAAETQHTLYQEVKSKVLNLVTSESKDEESLKNVMREAEDFGMQEDVVYKAKESLHWLRVEKKLQTCIEEVENEAPFVSTAKNYQIVIDLLSTMQEICEQNSSPEQTELPDAIICQLEKANELCARSKSEIELYHACRRLQDVECASESHVKLLNILKSAIDMAKKQSGDDGMIKEANAVLDRLNVELDLQKAKQSIPDVRLPEPDMTPKQAKAYFQPEDIGHIHETEEYPLPPPGDTGYIWIKSESHQSFEGAIQKLEDVITRAKECGCNLNLISESENILKKKRVDLNRLEEKDNEDREAAFVSAEKAAKKILKKQKGKAK